MLERWRRRPASSGRSFFGVKQSVGSRARRGNLLTTESLEARTLLAGDLMAHWVADEQLELNGEGSIASWTDQIGGRTASPSGTPILVEQTLSGRDAIRFQPTDGTDGFRVPAVSNPIVDADDFSVIVTFRSDVTQQGGASSWFENTGLVDSSSLGFATDWGVSINASGQISFGMGAGFGQASTTMYSDAANLTDGQLHTVAVSRSGSSATLYVDDAAPKTQTNFNDGPRSQVDLTFGMLVSGQNGFDGELAQVRLYDGALTAEEVTTIQNEIADYYSNAAPVTGDDAYVLEEDNLFFFVSATEGLLANDSDADGDQLEPVLVEAPQHGTLTINPNGSFLYSPDPDYNGADSFTYAASDSLLQGNTATVTLEITPVYDSPVPVNDTYKTTPNQPISLPGLVGILSNDRNVDNAPMTAILSQEISFGSLSLAEDGGFSFDPSGVSGEATFQYQIDDGITRSRSGTVTFIVNQPPSPQSDHYNVNEDEVLSVDASNGVLSNDLDPDSASLVLTLQSEPANGTLELRDDGSFDYTPNENFFGSDEFTYSVTDGIDAGTEIATVTLQIDSVNDIPTIAPDAYVVGGTELQVSTEDGLLANDTDIESETLIAELVSGPSNGALELQADGSFVYTPEADFTGNDHFSYRVSDGEATTEPVEVLLVVQRVSTQTSDPTGDSVVTFSELMYNPTGEEADGEWLELQNQMGINMDISGWLLAGGIEYEFPAGTIIPGNGQLVIAANPTRFSATTGIEALGPFEGRLSNDGEELQLINTSDRIMDVMEYNDRGSWPVGADGLGSTLAKLRVHAASGDAANWTVSWQRGGTPGAENFPAFDGSPVDVTLVDWTSTMRVEDSGTAIPPAWNTPSFDATAWKQANGLIEAGDAGFPPANPGGLAEPTEGLFAYWPIDAGTGDTLFNAVEDGVDGALTGNPRWGTDALRGNVLTLDGRNDHVVTDALPAIGVEDDFTWSVWFKQDDADAPSGVILGNRNGGSSDPLQFVKITPTNFEYYSGAGDPIIPYALTDDIWTHLAIVKDGPELTYYVNGTEVGSGITSSAMGSNPFYIGGDPDAGEYADGQIDDVALWSRALPVESIVGLADGSYSPLTAPTIFADGPIVPDNLPDAATVISSDAMTYYARYEFDFVEEPANATLQLQGLIDDGAVFYLNGTEVYRHNLPDGPIDANTPATENIVEIGATTPVVIPTDALRLGSNVLAVELHKHGDADTDALLSTRLVASVVPTDPNTILLPVLNEVSAGGADTVRVELFNPHDITIDLNGFHVGDYQLVDLTLAPQQYLVLTETELGDFEQGDVVGVISPRGHIAGAEAVDSVLRGRDADGRWAYPTQATFGEANIIDVTQDVVINEIHYHAPGIYVEELDRLFDNDEEWLELHNRSETETIDLGGWQIADGIEFTFPAGTRLAPGGFLVVSNDPSALIESRGLDASGVYGPFDRRLSDGGENLMLVDARGNIADEVRYYDEGRWDSHADAGGGSLELRDPFADNSAGSAWAASDESDRTEWQTIVVEGVAGRNGNDPTLYNEFLLGLLDAGVVMIDDVSVIENPDTDEARELIQNGTFEADSIGGDADKWRIIGTQHGTVIADPDVPDNQVLLIEATGPTEHMHNNAGTTLKAGDEFVRLDRNTNYRISYRARYVGGSNQLHSRLYFSLLPKATRLQRPQLVGTPGAVNSQRVDNIGPTYDGLIHSPAVPEPNQPVTVSVHASASQQLDRMTLHYSVNGGAFVGIEMQATEAGTYQGIIPGQAAEALVHFYVEGVDSAGVATMEPAAGPESRALYRVNDGEAMTDQRHNFRILMTDADTEFLHRRTNVMSNDRLGGTVIYRESEIFYDVGVRLKGSQRGRDQTVRVSFNIEFPDEQLFRGVHSTIGVDRSGSGNEYSQEEIIVRQVFNGTNDLPQIYDDLIHVIAPRDAHTGSAMLSMARYNSVFLDSQFENGSAGTAYEYELIYYPTTTSVSGDRESLKNPEPDNVAGVSFVDQGDDKERYRWHWLLENNRDLDDYSVLINAIQQLGERTRNNPNYHEDLAKVVDVDQWLRTFAVTILVGAGDNYSSGSQHNGIFYVRPSDNRLIYLPWDMDFSFTASATGSLITNAEQRKFMEVPEYERAYYGHVLDIINTSFNSEYMDPWIDHFDLLVPGQPHFQGFKNNIAARATSAVRQIESAVTPVEYAIVTEGSVDAANDNTVQLEGTAWVDVREIRLPGNQVPLELNWLENNRWTADVPVVPGQEQITLEAYDFQGELIGTQSITVTNAGSSPLAEALRITEIHYNPADPSGNEALLNNDDFEFIELMNISDQAVDLAGVTFAQVEVPGDMDGIRFEFDAQVLEPGERIVVAKNRAAFTSRYGTEVRLANGSGDDVASGVYGGQLANSGETLTLLAPNGLTIQQFAYSDDWYGETDGDGPSLELIDAAIADLSAWERKESWQPSSRLHGTPGAGPRLIGDINNDNVFSSEDILLAFSAGEYEDDIDDNSTYEEGDWNGDGDFTTRDLVDAFIYNVYVKTQPLGE